MTHGHELRGGGAGGREVQEEGDKEERKKMGQL